MIPFIDCQVSARAEWSACVISFVGFKLSSVDGKGEKWHMQCHVLIWASLVRAAHLAMRQRGQHVGRRDYERTLLSHSDERGRCWTRVSSKSGCQKAVLQKVSGRIGTVVKKISAMVDGVRSKFGPQSSQEQKGLRRNRCPEAYETRKLSLADWHSCLLRLRLGLRLSRLGFGLWGMCAFL